MAFRKRMSRRGSRKEFRRKSSRMNRRNMADARVMRGGYRL